MSADEICENVVKNLNNSALIHKFMNSYLYKSPETIKSNFQLGQMDFQELFSRMLHLARTLSFLHHWEVRTG